MTRQNLHLIYKNGNTSLKKLQRIADVLGVSEDSLLLEESNDAGNTQ